MDHMNNEPLNIYGKYGNLSDDGKFDSTARLFTLESGLDQPQLLSFLENWVEPQIRRHIEFAYTQLELIPWSSCEGHHLVDEGLWLNPTLNFIYDENLAKWLPREFIPKLQEIVFPDTSIKVYLSNNTQTSHCDSLNVGENTLEKYHSALIPLAVQRESLFKILLLLKGIKENYPRSL
jgi:hypothetical protein